MEYIKDWGLQWKLGINFQWKLGIKSAKIIEHPQRKAFLIKAVTHSSTTGKILNPS